jgi:hypothetical protein
MTLTPDKLEKIQTSATNRRIRQIISAVRDGSLLPRPDFQRKLVWTNQDKLHFLDTIVKHLPFPEIYVCAGEVNTETAAGTEWLVDGQQRVSTIYAYFNAELSLRLNDELLPYKELDKAQQERFLEYVVVVRDLGKLELDDVREIFQRINSTHYGLNAMELANARWDGAIKKFVQTLAEDEFFAEHRVFTASDIRRMMDASFCLSLVISMDAGYFDDTSEHAKYLERYNDEFSKDENIRDRVTRAMQFIESMELPPRSRWWKKADIFTLLIEVDDLLHREQKPLKPGAVKEVLLALEADLKKPTTEPSLKADASRYEVVTKYAYAAAQGSNHRKSRRDRGEVVRTLLVSTLPTSSPPVKKWKLPPPKAKAKGKRTTKK